jgi:hypothetical protein
MSSLDARSHVARRRRVTQPYLKATLQNSTRLHQIIITVLWDRVKPRLASGPRSIGAVVDVALLCYATVMDMVSGHIFGLALAPNLTCDENKRRIYQRAYIEASAQKSMFRAQEMPILSCLFPTATRTYKAKSFLETKILSQCENAETICGGHELKEVESPMFPGLYHFLRESSRQGVSAFPKDYQAEIASEVLDHLKATSDVLSITLTQALYQLSKCQQTQAELRSELRGLWNPHDCGRWLPSAKDLDALPLLDAIVCETLRLRPTAPDGQPRISQSITTLDGVQVPANVRISTYPYVLHHDETIFERPYEWNPQRWKDVDKNVHLWAFGVGARSCLGKQMATLREYTCTRREDSC